MDFIRVAYKEKEGIREFSPSLQAIESQDLVIRGGQFAAVWDADTNLYSRTVSHVPDIIDRAFYKMVIASGELREGDQIRKMRNYDNQMFNKFLSLCRSIGDMGPELDQKLIFADDVPTKADGATFKLPYSLNDGPTPAWTALTHKLYDEEERLKFEWAIGSIFTGAAQTHVQKFYVFFGNPGTGKSTIMDVIEMLFTGHSAAFSAFDLGKPDGFPLEPFMNNPLVAVDQDADFSKIETNVLLNKITARDKIIVNVKGRNLFTIERPRSTIFAGTNGAVKITDRKSGLFRRLVDIQPTGALFDELEYMALVEQVKFELGAIAQHCINVFNERGPTYLSLYRATDMMYRTNDLFNFVEDHRLLLAQNVSLKTAHKMWVEWCEETSTRDHYKQYQFRDLLKDYFKEFHEEVMIEGHRHRSYFIGLRDLEKFSWKGLAPAPPKSWLELDLKNSIFDETMASMPAQEATTAGTPKKPWFPSDPKKINPETSYCDTTLADIDTAVVHFVKVPTQHIVIDLDLKDDDGNRSLERCLEAAAGWPPTYVEVSRGGDGLHLHYDYSGDVGRLASAAADGSYEVKVLTGGASLRRKLTLCNDIPVATISSGLPLKEEKVLPKEFAFSERALREQILKALRKGVHLGTKSNMDFIEKILNEEAYASGQPYDVSDMWDDIFQFAMGSTNQRAKCLEIAMGLKLKSEADVPAGEDDNEKPIAYFDVEVFPNLFLIGYVFEDSDEVIVMINPTAEEVETLFNRCRLIGWNNRGYDNHICWAASLGATPMELYKRSQQIIVENNRTATFGAAYNWAYGDGYDMASNANMKSMKKWEIDLGLPHLENDHPWDEPVPEEKVLEIIEYLKNDVRSTKAVLHHIHADVRARQILAEMSGLAVCNTNRQHTEKLIFGKAVKEGHSALQYTHLKDEFPGYEFNQFATGKDKSLYRGVKVGEGGWVMSKPGMYSNVVVLDIASMHPASIIALNMFGEYTEKFKDLLDLRLAVKGMIKGESVTLDLERFPFLKDINLSREDAKALSDALKIVINSVYGLTAASFPNTFKDPRNIDNIVAKRGALFMVDLVNYAESMIEEKHWPEDAQVVHIKTDSIKIACPSRPDLIPLIVDDVTLYGKRYGYDFEHETTYEQFCLVNDAVYVAHEPRPAWEEGEPKKWTFTGKQFQHPVVNKTLFTGEDILPKDYIEVKQVNKGAMYLVTESDSSRAFVGRFGAFVPVLGGRQLVCIQGDKVGAVNGTKDHLWEIDEIALGEQMDVDYSYFQKLVDDARKQIEKYGSYQEFVR